MGSRPRLEEQRDLCRWALEEKPTLGMTDRGALKGWMYFKVFLFLKGKMVVLCLAVSVPSCGKAAAYLTSSLIAVSGSQGVVTLLLPLAKPVIFLCNAFDLEGVHFTVESCREMIRRKGEVQEKLLSLMVFYQKKKITRSLTLKVHLLSSEYQG